MVYSTVSERRAWNVCQGKSTCGEQVKSLPMLDHWYRWCRYANHVECYTWPTQKAKYGIATDFSKPFS